jgi:hypothetical protein
MSIFGSIMSRVFGGATASPSGAQAIEAAQGSGTATSSAQAPSAAAPAASTTPVETPSPASASPTQNVDVEAVLNGLAAKNPEKLDWHHSIVDLMKLLDLDSSMNARQALAHELNYSGSTSDSAAMNVWLHREVMQKLAANGGRLPASMQA